MHLFRPSVVRLPLTRLGDSLRVCVLLTLMEISGQMKATLFLLISLLRS